MRMNKRNNQLVPLMYINSFNFSSSTLPLTSPHSVDDIAKGNKLVPIITSHSEFALDSKPIEAYMIKQTKSKKNKKSFDTTSSHSKNETEIENDNEFVRNSFSNFSLEDEYNDEENSSLEDASSFDSSFDEIETAEINEKLLTKNEN